MIAEPQKETQEAKPLRTEKSCTNCGHVRVCALFRAITQLLSGWTDETKPFNQEDIASICKAFISEMIVETLNGE